ncbi:MAG: chorismate mutase, partial [bacterium]|nr:chorismate mutase [bacterium]
MSLDKQRKIIDALDNDIVQLLNRRASVAVEIARIKAESGAKSYYAPVREKRVYDRIADLNQGPLPDEALRNIYREVMSATLALEQPLQVAYLGPQTTFTHMACLQRFGNSAAFVPCDSIDAVFSMVERRQTDYGVVPIENSTEGAVNHTLDRFMDTDLKICGEL